MSERQNTQPKYPDDAPGTIVTAALAMLQLSSRVAARQLRVSDSLVRLWRTNRRMPAAWATELLATELERTARERDEMARKLRLCSGPGRGSTALTAWQAHRAAQKEKAGN
jgi:DNA-binding transcriptional regulator YiaG